MLKIILPFLVLAISNNGFAQQAPNYTDKQIQETKNRLLESVNQYKQNNYDEMSNYDKKMFELTQRKVGGYADIKTQNHLDLSELTEAEKESILRTRRNNEIIRKAMRGEEL